MRAGDLRERAGFYEPVPAPDGRGNTQAGFAPVPTVCVAAAIMPKLGGEAVSAGRLAGRQFVNITVRSSSATRAIRTDWKARDERAGIDYQIRSIIDPRQSSPERGRWLELLCEEGVAL